MDILLCTEQKLTLSKVPSSYTKSDIMLELGNLEYMFSPWRLECAKKSMKKHEFLRSGVKLRLKLQLTLKAAVKIHKLSNNFMHFSFSFKH